MFKLRKFFTDSIFDENRDLHNDVACDYLVSNGSVIRIEVDVNNGSKTNKKLSELLVKNGAEDSEVVYMEFNW